MSSDIFEQKVQSRSWCEQKQLLHSYNNIYGQSSKHDIMSWYGEYISYLHIHQIHNNYKCLLLISSFATFWSPPSLSTLHCVHCQSLTLSDCLVQGNIVKMPLQLREWIKTVMPRARKPKQWSERHKINFAELVETAVRL